MSVTEDQRGGRVRHIRRVAFLAACAIATTGCSMAIGPDAGSDLPEDTLNPAGPIARQQDALWDLTYGIAVGVFVLVFGLIGFVIVRFRDRGEPGLPKQVHGNTRLEIAWTVIPALILLAIAVPTVQTIFELAEEPAEDALEVQVVGKQYWWEFEYLESGVVTAGELHIPTDREVFLRLNGTAAGADVIHSFWIPRLAGKQDYVPGAERIMRLRGRRARARTSGQCAEFCGLSHANMRMAVIAHTPEDFEAWLASPAGARRHRPATSRSALGEEIVGQQCLACHTIVGHPALPETPARVGPELTHFAQRERFAGYILDNNAENLRAWVADPQEVKPGSQMPDLGLDSEQVDAVVAYLQTLE